MSKDHFGNFRSPHVLYHDLFSLLPDTGNILKLSSAWVENNNGPAMDMLFDWEMNWVGCVSMLPFPWIWGGLWFSLLDCGGSDIEWAPESRPQDAFTLLGLSCIVKKLGLDRWMRDFMETVPPSSCFYQGEAGLDLQLPLTLQVSGHECAQNCPTRPPYHEQ